MSGRGRKLTTEAFIEKAIKKHGHKFDYSKVRYKDRFTEVKIKCNACGTWTLERPKNHMDRHRSCEVCLHQSHKDRVISDFVKVHGDKYDYSKVVPARTRDKVKIRCKECDSWFDQVIAEHKRGSGCPSCARQRVKKNLLKKQRKN